MNSTNPQTLPAWLLWSCLVILAGLLSILGAELVLRVVPGPWTSSFFYVFDPVVGTWHLSNFSGDNASTDYTIRNVHFNQFGLRDKDRILAKTPGVTRIAFLGDSIIEGVQVANEDVITARMEETLGPNVEVLNFGVSGFGTLQEYLTYRERVRQFAPDVVIVGFYTGNDMRNNSEALESIYNPAGGDRPFMRKTASGWELTPVEPKPASQQPGILFLKRHFALYRFLWFARQRFASMTQFSDDRPEMGIAEAKNPENANIYLAQLFAPPRAEPFTSTWETTEYIVQALRKEVEADGAKFVLVAIPDPIVFDSDSKTTLEKMYGAPLPEAYDPEYPQKHLARFSRDLGISFFDLTPAFKAYRDDRALEFPYFSFRHDGHWSALGHEVAATAVADFLQENSFLHP